MHEYPLRIKEILFQRVKVEAESRGIKLSVMFREIIEMGLLALYEKEAKYGEIKFKQTNSE